MSALKLFATGLGVTLMVGVVVHNLREPAQHTEQVKQVAPAQFPDPLPIVIPNDLRASSVPVPAPIAIPRRKPAALKPKAPPVVVLPAPQYLPPPEPELSGPAWLFDKLFGHPVGRDDR